MSTFMCEVFVFDIVKSVLYHLDSMLKVALNTITLVSVHNNLVNISCIIM